jgi:hypothetical protein
MAWYGDRFMAAMRELRDAQREIEGSFARTAERRDTAIAAICDLMDEWDADTKRVTDAALAAASPPAPAAAGEDAGGTR